MVLSQAPNCLVQFSATVRISCSSAACGRTSARRMMSPTIDLTSPADPRAITRKLLSSAEVRRSKPSAMLLETERVARSNSIRAQAERCEPPIDQEPGCTNAPPLARPANLQIADRPPCLEQYYYMLYIMSISFLHPVASRLICHLSFVICHS